jgi:hypothetical protein
MKLLGVTMNLVTGLEPQGVQGKLEAQPCHSPEPLHA